jgi:hypothetical protein
VTAIAADQLGTDAWDALLDAGHQHFQETGDGFDILRPTQGDDVHVLIVDVRTGPLLGVGDRRAVTAQRLAPYEQALTAAGFAVARVVRDGAPTALVAAREEAVAESVAADLAVGGVP